MNCLRMNVRNIVAVAGSLFMVSMLINGPPAPRRSVTIPGFAALGKRPRSDFVSS